MEATTVIKAGLTFHSATVNGELRKWSVQTPDNYDPNKAYPLLFVFKGTGKPGLTPDTKMPGLFKKQVNARQYVAVYPEAVERGETGKVNFDVKSDIDLEFIEWLELELIKAIQIIKYYFFGISTGGCMAHWLYQNGFACNGMVTVAASRWQGLGCAYFNARVMQIHGTADNSVPYNGGLAHGLDFMSATSSIGNIVFCKAGEGGGSPSSFKPYPKANLLKLATGDRLFTCFGLGHDVFSSYPKLSNPGFNMTGLVFDFLEGKI